MLCSKGRSRVTLYCSGLSPFTKRWYISRRGADRLCCGPARRLLDDKAPSPVLTSMLLCLSQLARVSQDFYDAIRDSNAVQHVRPAWLPLSNLHNQQQSTTATS